MPSDLDGLCALRSDEEVTRFLEAGMGEPAIVARCLAHSIMHERRHGYSVYAVFLKGSTELIGTAGLEQTANGTDVELSYSLARKHWARGYATEAAAAWLRFGFTRLGLDRIVAVAIPEHTRSLRVLDKLGLRYEADDVRYRAHVVRYSMTREQFMTRTRAPRA